jgi:hypothetical protein
MGGGEVVRSEAEDAERNPNLDNGEFDLSLKLRLLTITALVPISQWILAARRGRS